MLRRLFQLPPEPFRRGTHLGSALGHCPGALGSVVADAFQALPHRRENRLDALAQRAARLGRPSGQRRTELVDRLGQAFAHTFELGAHPAGTRVHAANEFVQAIRGGGELLAGPRQSAFHIGCDPAGELLDHVAHARRPQPPERPGFSEAFRAGLLERMSDCIGGTDADVASRTGGRVSRQATVRLKQVVEAFVPTSWVRAGNVMPAVVQGRSGYVGGWYHHRRPPELHVDADPATSVHEYIRHLQYRVEGFHAPWRQFYRDRTTLPEGSQERAVGSKKYGSKYRVREDAWIDDYMGAVSELELAARVYEILSHGLYRQQVIGRLAIKDPELLNFAVGFLLRFEP